MIACLEAEAALLSCLLLAGPLLTRGYLAQVEDDDLTDPRHRAVLTAMRELRDAGQPADPITVLGQMRRSGLEGCMTADRSAGVFLADLAAAAPCAGSLGHYLLVVLEHRVRREVERTGVRLQQVAESSNFDTMRELVDSEGREVARQLARLAVRQSAEHRNAAA